MYKINILKIKKLLIGMRNAYLRGENMMQWARMNSFYRSNDPFVAMISYDYQSGNYVSRANKFPDYNRTWGEQLAGYINSKIKDGDSILEIGVGEGTTLASVHHFIKAKNFNVYGFDISWSRLFVAKKYISSKNVNAILFVADLFCIPLPDNSVDVVYSSHSLEPNGGKELKALKECWRITKKHLFLFEPIYELGSEMAKRRMEEHGYVKDLKNIAESLGGTVEVYKLLNTFANELNPSGVILITKDSNIVHEKLDFVCPISKTILYKVDDTYFSKDVGLAYPSLKDIPILKPENSILASKLIEVI